MNNHLVDVFSKSKHIAIIGQKGIHAEFPGTSGVEFYVEKRAITHVGHGKKVDCYVRNWATPKQLTSYQGISLIHVPTIPTKHLDAVTHSFLSSIHACFSGADTIWYQASGPALFCWIPKLFGKRIIVTIHTLEWKREKWGVIARTLLRYGERVGARCADTLLVVSPALRDHIYQTYKKDSFVEGPRAQRQKPTPPRLITEQFGLKGNDYFLYLGRFVPEKRIEWLIQAYRQLRPKKIKLIIAGGSTYDRTYEEYIRRLANNDPDIVFTGWVFGDLKRELLSNTRLFVLPSSIEGDPVTYAEVCARDKRCLVSDCVSTRNTHTSLFDSDSYDSFINALSQGLTSRSLQP